MLAPAVRDELERGRGLGVHLPTVADLPWIRIREPHTRVLLPLASGLGAGEIEVMALAKETAGHLALLDDRRARRFADLLGVVYTGTLGVLLKAKQARMLEDLAPICDSLEHSGFRMSPAARRALLSLAGEPTLPGPCCAWALPDGGCCRPRKKRPWVPPWGRCLPSSAVSWRP